MPAMRPAERLLLRCARERDQLALSLRHAGVREKVEAYKRLEKALLKEASEGTETREIQRRITEDLLVATSSAPWALFAPYLRRIERLGYSSFDRRILVCAMAAQAARGSRAGLRKAAGLIEDLEHRAARSRRLHPSFRDEIESALARARTVAGLPPKGDASK